MKKLFFCTGTNCSGKSSIAKWFIENEPAPQIIEFPECGSIVTVFPKFNLMIVGKYSAKTTSGGGDTIKKKIYTQTMMKEVWDRPENLFLEGYLIGTKVWIEDLLLINANGEREICFVLPNTSLETCFARIEGRSGKKRHELKGNGQNVVSKHSGLLKFREWLRAEKPQIRIIEPNTENESTQVVCNQLINVQ